MTYDEKIAKLRSMLEEHNQRLPEGFPKVVIDGAEGVMTRLMVEGGTTEEGLGEFTATDLKGFGFPTAASKAGARFIAGDIAPAPQQVPGGQATAQVVQQTPAGQQLIRVSMTDPATEIEEASNLELIARLNPVPGQTGRVGAELDRRAKGEAFLGFTAAGTVDSAASAARLHAIQNNQRVGETMMVEGRPVRPRRVGEAYLPQRVRVNYLFPEETLIPPDLECGRTGESMVGIADDVAQILIIEAQRPGGRPWGTNIEAARSVIEMARRPNASAEVRRRYKLAAVQYDEMAPNERPALERADDSSTTPREAGRGFPFAGDAQAASWASAPADALRIVILSSPEDRKQAEAIDGGLVLLRRKGTVATWLAINARSSDEPLRMIEGADAVLALFSADFLASDDLTGPVLTACRRLRESGRITFVPILARACDVRFGSGDDTGRMWYEKLSSVPRAAGTRPFASYSNKDEFTAEVAKDIRELAASRRRAAPTAAILPSRAPVPATYKSVTSALNSAFTTRAGLATMVQDGLGVNFNAVTAEVSNMRTAIHELVVWAESQGRLAALVSAAYKSCPGNEQLMALMGVSLPAPEPPRGDTYNITIQGSTVNSSAFGPGARATSHRGPSGERNDEDRLDRLNAMLPGEFDTFVARLSIPPAYLSGPQSPQATRAVDALRWARTMRRVCDVDDVLDDM